MTKLATKTIEKITYKGTQSISHREIYSLGAKKIKIEIKSDSYDFQSYARAELLKDEKWETVYSIPYSQMKTPTGLHHGMAYRHNAELAEKEFAADSERMKKYVAEILG